MVHEEEEEEEEELIVHSCQSYVCFELPSVMLKKRTQKFRNNITMNIITLATIYK